MFGQMKLERQAKREKSWAETNRYLRKAFDLCDLRNRNEVKRNVLAVKRMDRRWALEPVPHRKWNLLPWCRRKRQQRADVLRWGLAGDRVLRALWDKLERELE